MRPHRDPRARARGRRRARRRSSSRRPRAQTLEEAFVRLLGTGEGLASHEAPRRALGPRAHRGRRAQGDPRHVPRPPHDAGDHGHGGRRRARCCWCWSSTSSQARLDRARELKLPAVGMQHAPALAAFLARQQVTLTPAPADYEERIRAGDLDVVLEVDPAFAEDVAAGRQRQGAPRLRPLARPGARVDRPGRERCCAPTPANGRAAACCCAASRRTSVTPLQVEARDLATPRSAGSLVLVPPRLLRALLAR